MHCVFTDGIAEDGKSYISIYLASERERNEILYFYFFSISFGLSSSASVRLDVIVVF
jgi:hypothetical protein